MASRKNYQIAGISNGMGIWEKIVGKKPEGVVDIDAEIIKLENHILVVTQKLENEKGPWQSPPAAIAETERELQGLKDKLALFQEKRRYEEEKAGYR